MKKIPCIIAENVGRENAAENAGRRMRDVWDVHWFIGFFFKLPEARRCVLLRFPVKNIVSSDCPKNQSVFKKFKSEPIFHGNRSLPLGLCSLDSLNSERGARHFL